MKAKDLTTSLNLPPVEPLPEGIQKYFSACQDKLGLVPNVLKAHSFNIDKLNVSVLILFFYLFLSTILKFISIAPFLKGIIS